MRITRLRVLPVVFGICVSLFFTGTAEAGYNLTISCSSCQTTSDFEYAAYVHNFSDGISTTYTVVSNSSPMTAYVSVAGQWVPEYNPIAGGWFNSEHSGNPVM